MAVAVEKIFGRIKDLLAQQAAFAFARPVPDLATLRAGFGKSRFLHEVRVGGAVVLTRNGDRWQRLERRRSVSKDSCLREHNANMID